MSDSLDDPFKFRISSEHPDSTPIASDVHLLFWLTKMKNKASCILNSGFLLIYPNPSIGRFTVKITTRDESLESAVLRVTDFVGQIHFNIVLDLSDELGENVYNIQLSVWMKDEG